MIENQILFGDCRDIMRQWSSDGVKAQMCVTSPPYFGLRDYGVDGQICLEQTTDEYIAAMVDVFRCMRDVLADDGTLWLNIGDSYAGSYKGPAGNLGKKNNERDMTHTRASGFVPNGCKPKDLIGIPWMLAFALRADGWYLRQDIIWHKPNPMPESVRDRCTKAHEYIFLLSKSDRYFFDNEAMREPATKGPQRMQADFETARRRSVGPMARGEEGFNHQYADPDRVWAADGKRNRRSVWSVATRPYKGAHFATFPPALIEPCILAGSRINDIVLDPFMGSGTTAAVALQHGRRYLGCELNKNYETLQNERIKIIERKNDQNKFEF